MLVQTPFDLGRRSERKFRLCLALFVVDKMESTLPNGRIRNGVAEDRVRGLVNGAAHDAPVHRVCFSCACPVLKYCLDVLYDNPTGISNGRSASDYPGSDGNASSRPILPLPQNRGMDHSHHGTLHVFVKSIA